MKLRIKGNSIRVRLTKSEVAALSVTGKVAEKTALPNNVFEYSLETNDNVSELAADFTDNRLTMFVSAAFAKEWPENNVVGIRTTVQVNQSESLFLLLEKDFVCLDETTEDQSDNYDNPGKIC